MKSALIAAGGTGGHIIPALTIAKELKAKQYTINWLGCSHGLETKLIPEAGIPLHILNVKAVRGGKFFAKIKNLLQIIFSTFTAIKLIRRLKPQFILGMGGFVSAPCGLAAWLTRTPLIIHEQNAIPGFSNRILAKFATKTLEAYQHSFGAKTNTIYTGNPVRNSLTKINPPIARINTDPRKPLNILVLGGSRGALKLNTIVPEACAYFLAKDLTIWQQTGEKHLAATKEIYQRYNVSAKITAYIDDMDAAYNFADLVICRSGALTCAELTTVGVGSILIPYPYAVDDHQTANAKPLVKQGAAILIQDKDLNAIDLKNILQRLFNNRQQLLTMAESALTLNNKHAVTKIVANCTSCN